LVKRWFDVATAAGLLVIFVPVLAACLLAVGLFDGRPALFVQDRVGRGGRVFRIFKFRTMRREPGCDVTVAGDPRVTALGRWLRRYKLDELPQLWNVLRGDMSFVGPRPEIPAYVGRAAKAFRAVLSVRPGLTDWSSLIFRDEEDILASHAGEADFYERVLLPRKLALARVYVRRCSLLLDLRLILTTACFIWSGGKWKQYLLPQKLYARAREGIAVPGRQSRVPGRVSAQ
jgi:lipopolysaccharide/colanic/teichoic acid biosynthesis glycosyltransferase